MSAQSGMLRLCSPLEGASRHLLANTSSLHQGVVVALSCEEGYQLRGSALLECLEDAIWSHPVPMCREDPVSPATSSLSSVIIAVVGVACVVAALVLMGALWVIVSSCRRKRKSESSAQSNKLQHISMFLTSIPDSSPVLDDMSDPPEETPPPYETQDTERERKKTFIETTESMVIKRN